MYKEDQYKSFLKRPVICKYKQVYSYRVLKEKTVYAVLLEYDPERGYYSNLIEENGNLYGRHYDRWLTWNEDDISNYIVQAQDIPKKVLKTIEESISTFEEVNRRCNREKFK